MKKLDESQVSALQRGFYRGYPDVLIARELGLTHSKVYRFRVKSGITAEWVVQRRHSWWERLFRKGIPLTTIAQTYEVTRQTVYMTLFRRGVSVREVTRQIEEKRARAASGRKLKDLVQSAANTDPMNW